MLMTRIPTSSFSETQDQDVRVSMDGQAYTSFASSDYLGLASHPLLRKSMLEGVHYFGVGAGAHLNRYSIPHEIAEAYLSRFFNHSSARLASSGRVALLSVLNALGITSAYLECSSHSVSCDLSSQNHLQLSRFNMQDLSALEGSLQKTQGQKILIIEGVSSTYGTIAPLLELLTLAEQYGAYVYVDDTHGAGVLANGKGTLAYLGIQPAQHPRLIQAISLSAAFGLSGAVILGDCSAVESISPDSNVSAAVAWAIPTCLDYMTESSICAQFMQLCQYFNPKHSTPIILDISKSEHDAIAKQKYLKEYGFWVPLLYSPILSEGRNRLRFSVTVAHRIIDVQRLLALKNEGFFDCSDA
jgi:8-amino-7-oxononanoate synthase